MRLYIQPPARRAVPMPESPALILLGDNWNDYSYRTFYSLWYQNGEQLREIGAVRVLKVGQLKTQVPLPIGEIPGGRLPEEYGSLGASLDYYAALISLGVDFSRAVLSALGDVVVDPLRREMLANEEGFRLSLHRDRPDQQAFYDEVLLCLRHGGLPPDAANFAFEFGSGTDWPIVPFRFGPPMQHAFRDEYLPCRTNVVVGPNGTGKTQLLARLARIAYSPPSEREEIAEDGKLYGDIAFPCVVAISYSAFDEFEPPRLFGDDTKQIAQNLRDGTGRYVYCGLRDIAARVENPQADARLLSPRELANVFADRVDRLRARNRFHLFAESLTPLLAERSFATCLGVYDWHVDSDDIDATKIAAISAIDAFLGDDPAVAFTTLSSGHKIALHILACLAAGLDARGLVLIDEPETHIHPPLLAALMTGVRRMLETLQAYAVIATHSPVVAQETPAFQVHILERFGGIVSVRPPDLETFGENTGTLTREIFGLHGAATDYRNVLDRMVLAYGTLERIERRFGGPLSSQARAHVMLTLSRRT